MRKNDTLQLTKLRAFTAQHRTLVLALVLALVAAVPLVGIKSSTIRILCRILMYCTLAGSLNVINGYTGMGCIGYAGFFAVGAYTMAILSTKLSWSFWLILPLAGLLTAAVGVLICAPTLKMKGIYLSLITLGASETIRILALNWTGLTGGPYGIKNIPRPTLFGYVIKRPEEFYYMFLLIGLLFLFVTVFQTVTFGQARFFGVKLSLIPVAAACIAMHTGGENGALVSEAGMPAISDPGEELVRLCGEHGITVSAAPGPSAVITALAMSGLPTQRFTFEGFLSVNKKSRQEHLTGLKDETRTMIFYEAPHKLLTTLRDLADAFGEDRKISLCRELTKLHEEVRRMTLGEASAYYEENPPRGEFVLVVAGAEEKAEEGCTFEAALDLVRARMAEGLSTKDAVKQVAKLTGFAKNLLYDAVVK